MLSTNALLLTAEAGAEAGTTSMLSSFMPMILILVVLYFLMMRPQKKREKETQAMRSSLEVGDEITTIGGIVGTIVIIKEDYLVIETGSDRSKLRITKWAVQTNNTSKEAPAAAQAEGGQKEKRGLFGFKKSRSDTME